MIPAAALCKYLIISVNELLEFFLTTKVYDNLACKVFLNYIKCIINHLMDSIVSMQVFMGYASMIQYSLVYFHQHGCNTFTVMWFYDYHHLSFLSSAIYVCDESFACGLSGVYVKFAHLGTFLWNFQYAKVKLVGHFTREERSLRLRRAVIQSQGLLPHHL